MLDQPRQQPILAQAAKKRRKLAPDQRRAGQQLIENLSNEELDALPGVLALQYRRNRDRQD